MKFSKIETVTTSGPIEAKYGTIEFNDERGNTFMEMGITDSEQEYLILHPGKESLNIDLNTVAKGIERVRLYIKNNPAE